MKVKKRECLLHELILKLSGPFRRSNIATQYIPTGPQNDRIRMLKPRHVLDEMDPDDSNIFATNMIEKYASRPNDLEHMCYADFASTYISKNANEVPEPDDIQNYTNPVDIDDENLQVNPNVITLKNNHGMMRKRRKCVI